MLSAVFFAASGQAQVSQCVTEPSWPATCPLTSLCERATSSATCSAIRVTATHADGGFSIALHCVQPTREVARYVTRTSCTESLDDALVALELWQSDSEDESDRHVQTSSSNTLPNTASPASEPQLLSPPSPSRWSLAGNANARVGFGYTASISFGAGFALGARMQLAEALSLEFMALAAYDTSSAYVDTSGVGLWHQQARAGVGIAAVLHEWTLLLGARAGAQFLGREGEPEWQTALASEAFLSPSWSIDIHNNFSLTLGLEVAVPFNRLVLQQGSRVFFASSPIAASLLLGLRGW